MQVTTKNAAGVSYKGILLEVAGRCKNVPPPSPPTPSCQPPPPLVERPMGTTADGGKGQGKGKGRGEGRLGQGGRGRSQGGERPMGTTAYGGKGSKGRAANGDRPVGAASCRREQHTMASCQTPPPPLVSFPVTKKTQTMTQWFEVQKAPLRSRDPEGVPPGPICTKVRKKPLRKEGGENARGNGPPRKTSTPPTQK